MTFKLENFGKVSSANIELNGITIIAGPNGSGKSTIGRALMTWCSVLRRLEELITIERVKSVIFEVNEILRKADVPELRLNVSLERPQTAKKILTPDFWRAKENILWLMGAALPFYRLKDRQDMLQKRIEGMSQFLDTFAGIVEDINARTDAQYIDMILSDAFSDALGSQYLSGGDLFNPVGRIDSCSDSGKIRSAVFDSGSVRDCQGVGGNHVPQTFYIEPIHTLDLCTHLNYMEYSYDASVMNRYPVGELKWTNVLYAPVNKNSWPLERQQKQREIESILDQILAMIHGRLSVSSHDLFFHDTDIGIDVPMFNAASGSKSIAQIVTGIKNGYIGPDSLLIIDEPESNLHPEWQISFARFLVLLLVKLDIRVLLNTHSPFFLKAINVFADLMEISDKCSYYNMIPVPDSYRYKTDPVTDNIEVVFKAMSDPYSRLVYGEHFEVE